jgi:hypothetical protein
MLELLKSNKAIKEGMLDRHNQKMTESVKRTYGLDVTKKDVYDFSSPFFKWSNLKEASISHASTHLRESEAENVFQALLRTGINNVVNSWYKLVPVNHEQIMQTTISNKAIELYAPLQRGGVPKRVQKGSNFPEVKVEGLDIQVPNWKFGAIMAIERELIDDDQTSQILDRARDIAENMAILEDAWAFTKFIGAASTYAGDIIPASETYTTVWSTALTGGGANKPSAYVAFGQDALQAAHKALMDQLDLQGNKMLVMPNTMLVGSSNIFTARSIMNSTFYVGTGAQLVGGTGGTNTAIGVSHADNIMKGMYEIVESRFLPTKAWALGEAGRGIIFQRRDPVEMIQENPQSGNSFNVDEYRFRSRARWNVDWVEPRFWYLGNQTT